MRWAIVFYLALRYTSTSSADVTIGSTSAFFKQPWGTEVIIILKMTSNKTLVTIFVIAIIALFFVFRGIINGQENSELQSYVATESTSNDITDTTLRDSITLANGEKVSDIAFLVHYDANTWMNEFIKNKVAFDKNYGDAVIDIYGEISKITNDNGCATIIMQPLDDTFYRVVIFNCSSKVWVEDVSKLEVGKSVHISGTYSSLNSSEYEMTVSASKLIL